MATLIAYWKLDEASGLPIADSSGNGNDGTLSGTGITYNVTPPAAITFTDPRAMSFDGASGQATLGMNGMSGFLTGATPFSVACWVKLQVSPVGNQSIWSINDSGPTNYMALQCRPGLALIGMTGVTGLFIAQPATMPTDGLWHHWCYTSNNSSGGLFYLDGVLATADPIQEAPPSAGVPFQSFLANDFNSDIFNGSLDDAAVYSGILTPTEVATLAAGGQLLSITQQPVTTYFPAGGGSANLVIAATAGATFQWRRNGVNISGATSATYTRAFVYSDHGARFDCVVTLSSTSITSNAVPAYMLGGFDVFLRSGLVQSRDVGLFDPTKATPSSALAGTAAGASTAAGAPVGTGAFAATSAGAVALPSAH